ncbi:hypothetical protein OHQ88_33690 (plasmid) [Micromonospora zamorensis]|uniref:hypothetical protein n=1 Tax=Micromonospora zamorensis TaxID=709883 RepID=UPI002E1FCEF6
MTASGYGVERHEVDAAVRAVLAEVLTAAAEHTDLIARYHELTRVQRLWEFVGPRIVHALVAERGAALRATGLRQADLTEPALLGTQQRVSQIMRAADGRDPVAVDLTREREILVSDGSEEPGADPSWIIVDDQDCAIEGVAFANGDTIDEAIARFVDAGMLLPGTRVVKRERMPSPHSFQPDGYEYRWTVSL